MIESIVSLAFAVHSNRGAYALLLGSGVSRAAQIPTGWEVVIDLIERVAALHDEDTGGDPAAWFRNRYNAEPTYTALLSELANSQAERSQLLRGYFEPTADEREQGLKVPTAAHSAIASLVARGFVRVIVTTNFDRLLEQALEAEGVAPTVIATPDASEGALPLAHTACTIVKVHGDYLDARIRNTPEELAAYDERIVALLDRILDEYGLIVCGWSADWDTALRDAIIRSSSHRHTTFWATRRALTGVAHDLLTHRRGVPIQIADADSFFVELEEKVSSLEQLGAPHPLSPKLAAATLKRYLPQDRYRIRLDELVREETSRVAHETSDEAFPLGTPSPTREEMLHRLDRYEAVCATLIPMLAVGCYYGEAQHRSVWVGALDRLANRSPVTGTHYPHWRNLRLYPVVLVLYSGGLGALAAGKYETLEALLSGATVRQPVNEEEPLILQAAAPHVVNEDLIQPGGSQRFLTLASDRLAEKLREPLREFLPHDERYADTFDKFEYLLALAYGDYWERTAGSVWAPTGSYGWRQRRRGNASILERIGEEAEAAGEEWGFLQGQLFDGSIVRFFEIRDAYLLIVVVAVGLLAAGGTAAVREARWRGTRAVRGEHALFSGASA